MKETTLRSCHELHTAEVVQLLNADLHQGLSDAEISKRKVEFGQNRITYRPGISTWKKFLLQFHQPLAYILLIASAVTTAFGHFADSSVIFGVIFINAIVGYIQEVKAEKAIESLSNLVVTEITVRRNGRKERIPSEELVPGDVVIIQSGDRVPADLRLFEVHSLQVDESSLTGESLPVYKHANTLALDTVLADRKNCAFAGSHVTGGRAEGLAWAIGDQTEMGRIAWLISETEEITTPLTKKLAQFSRLLLWMILTLSILTFAIGILRNEDFIEMFIVAIALAVSAIPEGLPAAVTIVLAIGVARMAKRQAIIRKLPAVETLGSTTVICSDKTGTLTKNQMTVCKVFAGQNLYEVMGIGYEPKGEIRCKGAPIRALEHPQLMECLRAGVLCNDSRLIFEEGCYKAQGDPTEVAMLVIAEKAGLFHRETSDAYPCIDMIPFESESMFRATLHESDRGKVIYKSGALERLLDRCHNMLDANGYVVTIDKEEIQKAAIEMASKGLRVIAFARRDVAQDQRRLHHEHVTSGLTFLGLQAMIDPPRDEAIYAVRQCQQAGVAVKMVTGDHAFTARAIAEQIGILGERQEGHLTVVIGKDLETISDDELPEIADRVAVFARITPEQKLRLVKALQLRGHVIAMTGDGVNDAPALKQADIGVAMGITGTDVAKNAADIVLTDDNFATIEAAVEEGRGVFDNLSKFLVWTLPTNIGESLIILITIFIGQTLPILPVQLLWINMTTALCLGLMLAFEPKEKDLMQRLPRDPKQKILTFEIGMRTGLVSLIILIGSFWLFFWEMVVEGQGIEKARTAVGNVIVLVETMYLFNCRSLKWAPWKLGLLSNKWAIVGALLMVTLQIFFTYSPVMNGLFHTAPISGESWLRAVAIASSAFIVVEIEKWWRFSGRNQ